MATGAESWLPRRGAPVAASTDRIDHACFYTGTPELPIYVDVLQPAGGDAAPPLLLLHGGFHTGTCYLTTPDGRPGWARRFAEQGRRVFVADWPGHGRSPMFDGFAAMTSAAMARSFAALLVRTGPVVLLAHSAGGPFAWWLAEHDPDRVLGIVGVAPGPPPEMAVPQPRSAGAEPGFDGKPGGVARVDPGRPVYVGREFIRYSWTNAPQFPHEAFDAYASSIVPESAMLLNERFGFASSGLALSDPASVAKRPILVVTGEHDPRHSRALDQATARYLGADFVWLPDAGIVGNGHLLMIERNSDEIAGLVASWLSEHGL